MRRGVTYALISAVLFGASTPLAKTLVGEMSPLVLAGLLYAGSGVGLTIAVGARSWSAHDRASIAMPSRGDWVWLAGATLSGGVLGPVALMYGLAATPATTASLLLNLESVFTALFAWFLFRENFDRRILLGMGAIVAGGVVLAWTPGQDARISMGASLVALACFCWALDNNLTRRASGVDAFIVAGMKGVAAAVVNLGLAMLAGQSLPEAAALAEAMVVGLFGYGVSLVLFVLALRDLGSARAGAYFAVAPFLGAAVAVALHGEVVSAQLLVAGLLMALGVWLHLTELHEHAHSHEAQQHSHSHLHDEHHRHAHDFEWDGREPHTHPHAHLRLVHAHPHYPDIHHRHGH